MFATAYTPAQLVQTGQAKTLGIFYDHDGGIFDINAYLNDGSSH